MEGTIGWGVRAVFAFIQAARLHTKKKAGRSESSATVAARNRCDSDPRNPFRLWLSYLFRCKIPGKLSKKSNNKFYFLILRGRIMCLLNKGMYTVEKGWIHSNNVLPQCSFKMSASRHFLQWIAEGGKSRPVLTLKIYNNQKQQVLKKSFKTLESQGPIL